MKTQYTMQPIETTADDILLLDAPEEKQETYTNELMFTKKLIEWLNVTHFENKLPSTLVTFAVKNGAYGYATTKPVLKGTKNEYYLIALNPLLARDENGLAPMIDTIIHESIHLYCSAAGIKEVSNGNRYHNGQFKTIAEKIGLKCEKQGVYGWNTVNVLSSNLMRNIMEIMEEYKGSNLFRLMSLVSSNAGSNAATASGAASGNPEPSTSTNLKVWKCPTCGQKARAGKSANLVCGHCMERMV